jgi:AcrR family transcriptional regulator
MTASRTRLPRAERERRILDAAAREFDQEGFRGASMERIAEAAGITKALVYQYFASKEGVYTACAERGRAEMFAEMERAAVAAGEDPAAILAAVVTSYFDQLDQLRGSSYVLYGDAPRGAVDEMRRRNAAAIAQLLRAGSSLHDEDLQFVAQLIVGAGEQTGRWWLANRDVPRDVVKAKFTLAIGSAIAGLSAR